MKINELWENYDSSAKKRLAVLMTVGLLLSAAVVLQPLMQEYRSLSQQHTLHLSVLKELEQKLTLLNQERAFDGSVEQRLRDTLAGSSVEVDKFSAATNNWQVLLDATEPALWQWMALLRELPVSIQRLQVDEIASGKLKVNLELVRVVSANE